MIPVVIFLFLAVFLLSSGTQTSAWTSSRNHLQRPSPSALFAKKWIVIVGGSWAGLSTVDALSSSEEDAEITLLDASPKGPGGLAGGWRTPILNQPVEAGLHGFWREYRNTFRVMESIPGVELEKVLTPYTPSLLVSSSGRVALAPVLKKNETAKDQSDKRDMNLLDLLSNPAKAIESLADLLPPPLDIALLSEFSPTSPLTGIDRLSAIGLLGAWADFGQEDPDSWKRYDQISAQNLFRNKAGVSDNLYAELVSPLLHVLPMTPGYDCSAAAALSCFHVFALQTQGAFDVRWCRGSIAERIFDPWTVKLQENGVDMRKGARVNSIVFQDETSRYHVTVSGEETLECDAVIMAVGGTAMKRLAKSCPPLQALPESKYWDSSLRGVTCVAVCLFLKSSSGQLPTALREAMSETPVVVCGAGIGDIPELSETGFCIYDLQRLQDSFLLSNEAALEVDFFRADDIADLKSDDAVADLALRAVEAALGLTEPIVQSGEILEVLRELATVISASARTSARSILLR